MTAPFLKTAPAAFLLCLCLTGCAIPLAGNEAVTDRPTISHRAKPVQCAQENLLGDARRKLSALIGKSACELTHEDLALLLSTPVNELHGLFGFPYPASDEMEIMGRVVYFDQIPGLGMNIGQTDDSELPIALYLTNNGSLKGRPDLPLGYPFTEVMEIWGETEINTVGYAQGFSGEGSAPLEQLRYSKGTLCYDFTVDYYNVFLPPEEHELTVDLITVRRISPFDFLQSHIDIEKEMKQKNYSYVVGRGKRDSTSEAYFIVSIGLNSDDRFTAIEHYYIKLDYSEIIRANPEGRDTVIWREREKADAP